MKITKSMLISEIVSRYPELAESFIAIGVFCFGCSAAQFETLEQGLKAHGFNKADIDKFIKLLNNKVSKK